MHHNPLSEQRSAPIGSRPLTMKTALTFLSAAACLAFGACGSKPSGTTARKASAAQPADRDTDTVFGRHPSPVVRDAAQFGGGFVGILVGVPASIVLIPITYPLAAANGDKWAVLYPFGICYQIGATLFGGVAAPFAPSSYWATPAPAKPKS